jgi:chromosomal replication initiation ATPase DnaA
MYADAFVERVRAKRACVAARPVAPEPRPMAPSEIKALLRQARALMAEARAERAEAARVLADARVEAATLLAEARTKVEMAGPRLPSVAEIISAVAERRGVSHAAIVGRGASRLVVAARHEAIQIAHAARPDLSSTDLGRLFRRDHAAILYALRKGRGEPGRAGKR